MVTWEKILGIILDMLHKKHEEVKVVPGLEEVKPPPRGRFQNEMNLVFRLFQGYQRRKIQMATREVVSSILLQVGAQCWYADPHSWLVW